MLEKGRAEYLFVVSRSALEAPWCHRRLSFAFWQLEKHTFLHRILSAGHPGFHGTVTDLLVQWDFP